jgi:hypothetical protein
MTCWLLRASDQTLACFFGWLTNNGLQRRSDRRASNAIFEAHKHSVTDTASRR